MRVVHINTSDVNGGAARAARRINSALSANGADSNLIVLSKKSDDKNVIQIANSKFKKIQAMIGPFYEKIPYLTKKMMMNKFMSSAWLGFNISNNDIIKDADVINLHWINNGFLSLKNIEQLLNLNKRIVWTIHDSWSFTGGCHVTWECTDYMKSCSNCEVFCGGNKITNRLLKDKINLFNNVDLTVVAPSNWLADRARKSTLFKDKRVEVIPNCLDISIYKPIDKKQAREILNLPQDKKLILFAATGEIEDKNKGFEFLKQALVKINNTDYSLLVIGANRPEYMKELSIETYYSGMLHDDYSLSLYYSAADIYVGPSLEESFGQTYSEAMACGIPCIAFDYSGPKDIIDHKENGYLARYKSVDDIVEGIRWILNNKQYETICKKARLKVERHFTYTEVSKKYLSIYNEEF